jgi:phage shock protein A
MTKPMNPLLKPENRKEFIQQAMKAMSDRQEEVIAQADKIIGDVVRFEENIHQKFISYAAHH